MEWVDRFHLHLGCPLRNLYEAKAVLKLNRIVFVTVLLLWNLWCLYCFALLPTADPAEV